MIETPFTIGGQYWRARVRAERVTIPCPVCKGKRTVRVEFGDGEMVTFDCDACGLGFDRARGFIEEYTNEPAASPFVIAGVDHFSGNCWTVRTEAGETADWSELRATEAEAMEESRRRCAENEAQNMLQRKYKRAAAGRSAWSVQYHRNQIKEAQRKVDWHSERLHVAKAKAGTDA